MTKEETPPTVCRAARKPGWKIALIVLGSLVGLVLVLLLLAFIALRIALTPANLTKIVNNVAENYVHCESHFERVELSFFKTFPNVGLEVKNVFLVNPYELPDSIPLASRAGHNDTLASIGSLTIGIDAMAFLKEDKVIVHQLCLDDVTANLYTAPDGWNNLDVFDSSDDEDTTSTELNLALIDLNKIRINRLSARYCDLKQGMMAEAEGLDLAVDGRWQENTVDGKANMTLRRVMADLCDSTGAQTLYANISGLDLGVKASGPMDDLDGKMTLDIASADVDMGGTSYMTAAQRPKNLLKVSLPFHANFDKQNITLKEAFLRLLDYTINLDGSASLDPMDIDVAFRTDTWNVKELLAALPPVITDGLKGMDIAADLALDGNCQVSTLDSQLSTNLTAHVVLDKGTFSAPKMLPMKVKNIKGDLDVEMTEAVNVKINNLGLKAENTTLNLKGKVNDVTGDMRVDANLKGNLNLPDLKAFLPDTMPIALHGTSDVNLHLDSRLSDITDVNLKKMKLGGHLLFHGLDVLYDSIHAVAPDIDLGIKIPATANSPKPKANRRSATASGANSQLIGVTLKGPALNVNMLSAGLKAALTHPDIQVDLPDLTDDKQPLAAVFDIACKRLEADMDSMRVGTTDIALKGSVRNDTTQSNVLKQWNPHIEASLKDATVKMAGLEEALRMPTFLFTYEPEVCEVRNVDIRIGRSDYHLYGRLHGLEGWMDKKDHLRGDLYFNSQYTDVDQLLDLISGLGTDEDTLAKQREEDNVPAEANPFIVPRDVNVTLHTDIQRCLAWGNDLEKLKGTITVNNGAAILDQIGFTCKAAQMQLTGIYKSPRVNHLFLGLDFHLLDITVEDLVDMIPAVDTLVPMLTAFKGKANFHLAAECNLDAFYQPKMSTLLGAMAISGQNLVVMDDKSISDIAKLLQMKDWHEKDNTLKIDSLSVEGTVFRKEIIVYPFLLNLHNYSLCIGGRHTLDNACNYHVELLKSPLLMRLAVDVKGSLDSPKISLGSVKYGDLYKPEKQNAVQARTLELKKTIRQALEANVR